MTNMSMVTMVTMGTTEMMIIILDLNTLTLNSGLMMVTTVMLVMMI